MPTTIAGVEYLTTAEGMALIQVRSRETWKKLMDERGFKHTTQVGKKKRYLWKRSDVEQLLLPIVRQSNDQD